jgi:NAD(P)-dependent dehydrogenase (short-subunit alcohol dehydrogenase family)
MCARDARLLDRAQRDVAALASPGQQVLAQPADVSDEAQVEAVAASALGAFPQLHILVNNAGIYGPFGPIDEINWKEWVRAIEVNLFGSILMCRALLPHFKAQRYGKIVQLSGGGATNPLPRISAYAASKAAIVRFAETLAEEVREDHIDVNAIAPGALNTRLLDEVLAGGPERVGQAFYELGSAASDGITAKLLSALWDPWETLPDHLDELRRTDVYTLRRIVPADRGLSWGRSDG